jgi:hypothetical protein
MLQPAVGELRYGGLVYILSLALILLTILFNLSLPGLKIIALGLASNFLVITLNLGQMPVALDKLRAAGYTGQPIGRWSKSTVMGADTPLPFLGDNILVGHPWPMPTVISIGDLILILGIFWFFQQVMVAKRKGEAPETAARHQQSP